LTTVYDYTNVTTIELRCVSKNRTPITFSNDSNNRGSISTNFGKENRHFVSISNTNYFVKNIRNQLRFSCATHSIDATSR